VGADADSNRDAYMIGPRGPEYQRDDQTQAVRWYCYDGLGSVLGEVDAAGNLTASRKYDVYGLVRAGDSGTSRHKCVGSLGHTSEDATGVVYMRARWMDPALGRFISEDPARDGANWFEYCRGNPVNAVDRDGKVAAESWCLYWIGVTTAAVAALLYYYAAEAKCTPLAALAIGYAFCAVALFMAALDGSGAQGLAVSLANWAGLGLGGAGGSQAYTFLVIQTLEGMSVLGRMTLGVGTVAAGAMAGYALMTIAALLLTEVI